LVELNEQQKKAAEFLDGIAVVIAVPGSGKTLTMTHRISHLVSQQGIAPETILGLTFTRNAAKAMRRRLAPLLDDLAERVMLSTIHSFCHYLIRNEGKAFTLLCGKYQLQFLRDILKDLKVKNLSLGMILREISLAKNNLVSLDEFRALYEGDSTMLKVAEVFEEYEFRKAKKMLLDFDDLLLEALRLLDESEEVRDKYRESFQHLLVDEFQDTNPAQMEVVKRLMNESTNGSSLWVCGDDWQSIYAFNGASIENILNFQKMFPGSQCFLLNENYRSTPQILAACQNLIQHNERRIDKRLTTQNPDGEDIVILECSSEEDESIQVCNEIRELVEGGHYAYKDIAVLYRANFQSRTLEETFSQHEIPYSIEKGMNFYQRREVRVLLDYMRLIHVPESDEALKTILNVPNRYIGKKFLADLEVYATEHNEPLYASLKSISIAPAYLNRSVRDFVNLMDPLIESRETLEPVELIRTLRNELDYDRFISEDEVLNPDDSKVENLDQLELAASRFNSIEAFLDHTETFQDTSKGKDKNGVSLMTIHKAKGLEFPVVFLVGLVEGILPSSKGNLEEERRICFVGMSRAMHLLYLSYSLLYLGQPAIKSPFLDEIRSSTQSNQS